MCVCVCVRVCVCVCVCVLRLAHRCGEHVLVHGGCAPLHIYVCVCGYRWLQQYHTRLVKEARAGLTQEERTQVMNDTNPR